MNAEVQELSDFEDALPGQESGGLFAQTIDTIQINTGRLCNLACEHCHLDCSPERREVMPREVADRVVEKVRKSSCSIVELTGGAPELHPEFRYLVTELAGAGRRVQVRTNLVTLLLPRLEGTMELLREHEVNLIASLPCYLEENVDAQRGDGTYKAAVEAIRRLNELGYAGDDGPELGLVYNPGGPVLPGVQSELESAYRDALRAQFGIEFTRLYAITNMPIGRFREALEKKGEFDKYLALLKDSFNGETLDGLMCRHQVCVDWDGSLYDCDFNLALGIRINHGAHDSIDGFDESELSSRRIMTGTHCFGCTAGAGSSCGGELA